MLCADGLWLAVQVAFGRDGNFSEVAFRDTVNACLANSIGNMLNRWACCLAAGGWGWGAWQGGACANVYTPMTGTHAHTHAVRARKHARPSGVAAAWCVCLDGFRLKTCVFMTSALGERGKQAPGSTVLT